MKIKFLLFLLFTCSLCVPMFASGGDEFAKAQELEEKIHSMPPETVPEALLNETAEHLKKAISEHPDVAKQRTNLTANLGQFYQNAGNARASLWWWQKTVELNDADWRAWAKIVQCCQTLGDFSLRDQVRKRVIQLYEAGKVDQQVFCVDQFTVGNDRVMALQYFKPTNENIKVTYSFNVMSKDGKPRLRYTLAELPIDTELARASKKIGQNEHVYSLDRYDLPHHQSLVSMFYGEKPTEYDLVKKAVLSDIPKVHAIAPAPTTGDEKTGGKTAEQVRAIEMARQLVGFNDASKQFSIVDSNIGCINLLPDALYLELKVISPKSISSVWWWNYLKDHKPTANWYDMIPQFNRVEKLVEAQPWLLAWKAEKGNSLEAHIAGDKCYSEKDKEIKEYVLPAWRDAGLRGMPDAEVLLRRDGRWSGTLYLSGSEKDALVLAAKKGGGDHWLNKQEISFHPKKPEYLLVHPNGTFEIRKIDPKSNLLPDWARAQ